MSYQDTRPGVPEVVCDICQATSWIGDPQWRPMPHSTRANPLHLCTTCRLTATWCEAHQSYHALSAMHRRACEDCGGLFTSVVRHGLTRCPSCRRVAGDYPPAQPTPELAQRPRSFLQRLFSLRVGEQR